MPVAGDGFEQAFNAQAQASGWRGGGYWRGHFLNFLPEPRMRRFFVSVICLALPAPRSDRPGTTAFATKVPAPDPCPLCGIMAVGLILARAGRDCSEDG